MAAKTYTVSGVHEVLGHAPGESFKGPLPEGINEEALLASGALELGEAKPSKEEKLACPACKDEGKKRVPSFETHEELVAHYADKHPALQAPPAAEA